MSEQLLLGHGPGATAPAALSAEGLASARGWLDATASASLLAAPGAGFDDAAAVLAWARRAWADVEGGTAASAAAHEPLAVAWRAGPGRSGRVGATWLTVEAGPNLARLQSLAPLWAGVLAHWARSTRPKAAARLLVVEGPFLTVLDCEAQGLCGLASTCLEGDDASALAAWLATAPPDGVWVAGHGLPGVLPAGLRPVPGLGLPSQQPGPLLAALAPLQHADPALRQRPALSPLWAAALLTTSVAVLALAAWPALQARQALETAQARAQLRAQAHALQVTKARAGQTPGDAADLLRLQQPWAQRFAVAEAAQPADGGWLRLEQRRDQPRLVLAGQGASAEEALAMARQLASQPGVAEAAVLRSETLGAGTRSAARFEIGVQLSTRALRRPAP